MEALERRRLVSLLIVLCAFCSSIEGQRNNTKMSYVCPPMFIRLGHSCYFFSEDETTWHKALFACKDRDSSLSIPARWEDRNLRKYLNKRNIEKESRWIGGIFDDNALGWRWGGELRQMHYQSFSKMKKMSPKELQFHCISMMPELLYRWAPSKCSDFRRYICQTKLRKVPRAKVKDLRRRWQRMGKLNEITVPSVSREDNDRMINDVTSNPAFNPKSFDLQENRPSPQKRGRPNLTKGNPKNLKANELRKRSRPVNSRLTRPFPGYTWNRRDPEGSFQRNAELLRSGRTGLSAQQIKAHLGRLQRLRDRQIARRRRLQDREDWLVNEPKIDLVHTHARTYTIDNNISELHPKTIVEEFDMFPQPIAVRPARGTG